MKFEKFLKGCGTHGQILERANGDKWLVCGGVGMKVPAGVVNLLGSGDVSEKVKNIAEALVKADTDDKVALTKAYVPADGKASDIRRIFEAIDLDSHYQVSIMNCDFGLLEKSDVNLAQVDIEDENLSETSYLLVLNRENEAIGFIRSV